MAISASLLKQLEEQWQTDEFFGCSLERLGVAPEGWWTDGENPEVDLDQLFAKASQQFESCEHGFLKQFADPATLENIERLRKSGIPVETQKNTSRALKVWSNWAKQRVVRDDEEEHMLFDDFVQMRAADMPFWLCRFVTEARRVDGKVYPPNTLYQLACGLMRALKESGRAGINFFLMQAFFHSKAR